MLSKTLMSDKAARRWEKAQIKRMLEIRVRSRRSAMGAVGKHNHHST